MARRKRDLFSDDRDRWIVSYADFMTLLFAFFVVMYAVSSINAEKYREVFESTKNAFTQGTRGNEKSKMPDERYQQVQQDIVDPSALALSKQLEEQVDPLDSYAFDLKHNGEWIELEIKTQALFSAASATPNARAEKTLIEIADFLKKNDYYISVEGYTDNRPIKTFQFPSNWELSAARAASVARILTTAGVKSDKLSAIGFGDQHAIDDNETPSGRANNRRVILVITKNRGVRRLLNPKKALIQVKKKSPESQAKKIKDDPDLVDVPVVDAIRLEDGSLKFTRGTEKVKPGE